MKTKKQWFETLPPVYRDRAISNTRGEGADLEDASCSLDDAISGAFIWSDTPEGNKFWSAVANGKLPPLRGVIFTPEEALAKLAAGETIANQFGAVVDSVKPNETYTVARKPKNGDKLENRGSKKIYTLTKLPNSQLYGFLDENHEWYLSYGFGLDAIERDIQQGHYKLI